jgi:hypothetical protein
MAFGLMRRFEVGWAMVMGVCVLFWVEGGCVLWMGTAWGRDACMPGVVWEVSVFWCGCGAVVWGGELSV